MCTGNAPGQWVRVTKITLRTIREVCGEASDGRDTRLVCRGHAYQDKPAPSANAGIQSPEGVWGRRRDTMDGRGTRAEVSTSQVPEDKAMERFQ